MSATIDQAGLETAIAGADLSDEEAERVRAMVADEWDPREAVKDVLATRETAEPELEPEPAGPAEPGEPTRKQLQSLDREQERHEKRVHEIMGGFVAGFEACRECGGVGFVPPGPKPQTHDWFIACPTCAGFGQVLTGSLRQGQEQRDCPSCAGRGYLEKLDEAGAPLARRDGGAAELGPAAAPPSPPELQPAPQANGQGDRFGVPTWMGDPAIGR